VVGSQRREAFRRGVFAATSREDLCRAVPDGAAQPFQVLANLHTFEVRCSIEFILKLDSIVRVAAKRCFALARISSRRARRTIVN